MFLFSQRFRSYTLWHTLPTACVTMIVYLWAFGECLASSKSVSEFVGNCGDKQVSFEHWIMFTCMYMCVFPFFLYGNKVVLFIANVKLSLWCTCVLACVILCVCVCVCCSGGTLFGVRKCLSQM